MNVVQPHIDEPRLVGMLRDEIHRHVAIELGEVGLDLPETRPLAKLVRLPGEVALPIRHEYARAQPFEGGEALVEAVGGGPGRIADVAAAAQMRSEEHTSELQSLMRISYAVFCLKKKPTINNPQCSISMNTQEN